MDGIAVSNVLEACVAIVRLEALDGKWTKRVEGEEATFAHSSHLPLFLSNVPSLPHTHTHTQIHAACVPIRFSLLSSSIFSFPFFSSTISHPHLPSPFLPCCACIRRLCRGELFPPSSGAVSPFHSVWTTYPLGRDPQEHWPA